jgi:hypothetical protein
MEFKRKVRKEEILKGEDYRKSEKQENGNEERGNKNNIFVGDSKTIHVSKSRPFWNK